VTSADWAACASYTFDKFSDVIIDKLVGDVRGMGAMDGLDIERSMTRLFMGTVVPLEVIALKLAAKGFSAAEPKIGDVRAGSNERVTKENVEEIKSAYWSVYTDEINAMTDSELAAQRELERKSGATKPTPIVTTESLMVDFRERVLLYVTSGKTNQ
jgi:hypothetical protein